MTLAICGRPPVRNLRRDGWEEVADFIAARIRQDKVGYAVHVAPDGAVRLTRTDRQRHTELPDGWKVGEYAYSGLRVEFIEDDLIERTRELAA
jgi:hypothetical protein